MMRGLKKTPRQYATLTELLVRVVMFYVIFDVFAEMFNGCCTPVSAVQNKHMFVYNPDSGRTVVINASLVDVSPILILYHS